MTRKILFLCTGNTARSQMGEFILRKRAGSHFEVYSAGANPKEAVFPPVAEVMKEIGMDLTNARPKGVETFLGKVHFEKVFIVCADADKQCPHIFSAAQRVFWPFEDPAAAVGSRDEILAFCRKVRDQIDRKICEWLKEEGIEVQSIEEASSNS
ncbi:MAG: arsenate reductase ArsC [Desulfobacteraceae bacterium]|nr:MAG: arsenate reductase ArsC [Desulfobacteraceae bacterium]